MVPFNLFCLDCKLVRQCASVLIAQLTHLALLQQALELGDPVLEVGVLLLHDDLSLADLEQLRFPLVALLAQSLKLHLFLLVSSDEPL